MQHLLKGCPTASSEVRSTLSRFLLVSHNMANILGVPEYDPSLDRLNMQLQSQAIQQLGAQVRSDLTQIQTNRQLQGFSQGLQGLSTNSPDFGRGVVGLMTQYPLAAHSPVGQAAINTLGAEHK